MSVLLHPAFLSASAMIVVGALAVWYLIIGRHDDDGQDDGDDLSPKRVSAGAGGGHEADDRSPGTAITPRSGAHQNEQEGEGAPVAGVTASRPDVGFDDVAGLEDAITELQELQDYLLDPVRFRAVGAELPRGVLLHGPPGNGKTLLARALAGETGVPFHSVSAASFVEQYVGVGAARIRSLFEQAKEDTPAIVFIDELDAVGRRRSDSDGGGREFDHTLNQLLVELDGTEGGEGVLILGATNRPELLDDALTRPGRFDRRIAVRQPDLAGREQILRLHAEDRPVAGNVDWTKVAQDTAGLSAAELAGIVNEAALLAARGHQRWLTTESVDEAMARVRRGTRRSRLLDDRDKHRLAVHEAGHAVLGVRLRDVIPPAQVSIVARAGSRHSPWWSADDREVLTKRELMAQLIALLGGRAAEQLILGEPSTRAEDDLEDAAELARQMISRWAMTGRYELAGEDIPAAASAPGVRTMVDKAERAARQILTDHSLSLKRVAHGLVRCETLRAEEVEALVSRGDHTERRAVGARAGSSR